MNFLAARVAATEGAFFSQQSKNALLRLKDKVNVHAPDSSLPPTHTLTPPEVQADALPEILRHSFPSENLPKFAASSPGSFPPQPGSLAASLIADNSRGQQVDYSQVRKIGDGSSPLALLASVPQTTLGAKRWKLEFQEVPVLTSTANEATKDSGENLDSAKLNDLVKGYFSVFKAFAVATGLVLGGGAVAVTVANSKLQIHSLQDIPKKGHDYMQPKVESFQHHLEPWKQWAQQMYGRWHMDESEYKAIGAEFAQSLGIKQRHRQSNVRGSHDYD